MTNIKWGIIGAGDVCEVKSGPALMQIPNSSVVAVMRRNGAKAKDFAERHRIKRWYDDADQLLNDPEVNAIYIATPPNTHATYTVKAAKLGKAVYVEKPMARTAAECEVMINACRQYGVPLYVAYYRRAFPNILKIKSLLDSSTIGEVRMVKVELLQSSEPELITKNTLNWRIHPEISGGGYFYDLASHQLDALDYIFGPISNVKGISRNQSQNYDAHDFTTGIFEFENGIIGSGTWGFNVSKASGKDVVTIIGSEGQISFPFYGDNHVLLERDGFSAEKYEFNIGPHVQNGLLETVISELTGGGKSCVSTGISAARTNLVMEQMVTS